MRRLHIDIETYSSGDLPGAGLYKYAAAPDFEILLVAYARDEEPVQIVDLAQGEALPGWFLPALLNDEITKVAHNAAFERVCFSRYLRDRGELSGFLSAASWLCTMTQAARCGLPLSLKDCGAALGLPEQKMREGAALIKRFCLPQPSTLLGAGRIYPDDAPEDWETFKRYCVRDVEVEREIDSRTSWYVITPFEQHLYAIDQKINDYGVLIDLQMVRNAAHLRDVCNARLSVEAAHLTGLSNPNSVAALKSWFAERVEDLPEKLGKAEILDLTKHPDKLVARVASIRAELGKTSNAKYDKMQEVAGDDGRARGLTLFYGTRTGRWAGRLLQMQNLPQNHLPDLNAARDLVKAGDLETLELCFGNVPDTLSQLIRTAFIAPEGRTFAVCDFSAIEARVVAWLAGESWVLDTFRNGGDIYCATASQMFGVPVQKHGPNAELRQKGKIAVLALGYGGGTGALAAMGGERLGLTEPEMAEIVQKWRNANPRIVETWRDIENAAAYTATTHTPCSCRQGVSFYWQEDAHTLVAVLPSGRWLSYPDMSRGVNRFGKSSLRFRGLNQETNKYGWIETWGGKLTENIVQAVARDCLAFTMSRLFAEGFDRVTFHVHDEIICEVDRPEQLAEIEAVFSESAPWAPGLPLRGAGYTTKYYLKD